MVAKRIEVEPESELAQLLLQAKEHSVVLEFEGERFRVEKEQSAGQSGIHEPEGGYDAERFADTLRQVAGSISVDDAEKMKAYIYAAREAGSRPIDK